MKKTLALALSIFTVLFMFAGCSAKNNQGGMDGIYAPDKGGTFIEIDGDLPEGALPEQENEVGTLIENKFIKTADENVSTFSADVDTASYSFFRKLVNQGYSLSELISTAGNSIRTEEMINYFDYSYAAPKDDELFGVTSSIADCPWNKNAKLMVLGFKAADAVVKADNNLVFLIDVSGSMMSDDKLPLLKKSFAYLVDNLDENDRVSIVTYSGREKVVLEGCKGNKKDKIMKAVNSLEARGGTNGEAGLKMAYATAEKFMIEGGNNRIIMASDGDLNVGISSPEELKSFVETKRDAGIYISVLGFGSGNYKDARMETLADNGNGVYYYIDGEKEAEKIFGTDLLSTLYTVAKDVKLQLTFNKSVIDSYRLVGYENRILNKEDFENDLKDAGDVGAGHAFTVCYELILCEGVDSSAEGEWMNLAVRYKKPDGDGKSILKGYSIDAKSFTENPDADFKFICGVVETSMILHKSEYIGNITIKGIADYLGDLDLSADEEKLEFISLLNKLI